MNSFLLYNIILSFLSLTIVIFSLLHIIFLYKKFKHPILKPFLILFILFSLLSSSTFMFYVSSYYLSITISKLCLLLTTFIMSMSIYFSIQFNAKNLNTKKEVIFYLAILTAGTNIICVISYSYNYLTNQYSLLPIISSYIITILFTLIIIILPFLNKKDNDSIVTCLLDKKVYFNVPLLFILTNDFYQLSLNLNSTDSIYYRFFIMYYFIFHCTFFLFKGHVYLTKTYSDSQNLDFKEKLKTLRELSDREKEIAELILKGESNTNIATQLFISLPTVKTHNTNIFKKLNVKSRYELMFKVI